MLGKAPRLLAEVGSCMPSLAARQAALLSHGWLLSYPSSRSTRASLAHATHGLKSVQNSWHAQCNTKQSRWHQKERSARTGFAGISICILPSNHKAGQEMAVSISIHQPAVRSAAAVREPGAARPSQRIKVGCQVAAAPEGLQQLHQPQRVRDLGMSMRSAAAVDPACRTCGHMHASGILLFPASVNEHHMSSSVPSDASQRGLSTHHETSVG